MSNFSLYCCGLFAVGEMLAYKSQQVQHNQFVKLALRQNRYCRGFVRNRTVIEFSVGSGGKERLDVLGLKTTLKFKAVRKAYRHCGDWCKFVPEWQAANGCGVLQTTVLKNCTSR